jgi:hypothetical protein
MKKKRLLFSGKGVLLLTAVALLLTLAQCGDSSESRFTCYRLSKDTQGCIETVNNILNMTVVSRNENVYKAEYDAGFIQGKLQKNVIISARDNNWDNLYLTDPSHSFPKQLPPSQEELAEAQRVLRTNYIYTIDYIENHNDPVIRENFTRLIFRLLGLYHGTQLESPASLDFSGQWLPDIFYFSTEERLLGYETPDLTFMDIYFVNGVEDMADVISSLIDAPASAHRTKCSAFVKKTDDDIYITHNSWAGFLAQSMIVNLYVNGDFLTFNAISPGVIGSLTDFGYNNKGIMFNETTHHATYSEPKSNALWMFWRATLAEQFGNSLDEFFSYVSLEPSGTYMNGYMIVDTKTNEIGLVEMSYKSFVYFRPDGQGGYTVITKPDGLSKAYDADMVKADYIIGINYPASYQIRDDLKAQDTRPARKRQFLEFIGVVHDIETAKALITYTDPENPLSIYGRWDLGYGETPTPKTVPDGSIDAKAASASMTTYAMDLIGVFDGASPYKNFWMKYGTPHVNGSPFIWSQSQWSGQKLRDVPDVLDGNYNLLNLYIR